MNRDDNSSRPDETRDVLDERLDAVLHELRDSYNVPPALPPLEAMWARIDSELDAATGAAPVAGAGAATADVVPLHAVRRDQSAMVRARRFTSWIGIAAALVIGVGVGRMSVRPTTIVVDNTRGSGTDVTKPPKPSGPERASVTAPEVSSVADAGIESNRRSVQRALPRATGERAILVSSVASRPVSVDSTIDEEVGTTGSTGRYLGQATALMIALANESPRPGDDARLARRARDLLTMTRLLLDGPSADESSRELLEDLELVLTQVVRLQSESGREELRLIREALEQRDLLPRLHTAVVSGSDD